jgi:hypothetical protein
MALSKSFCGVCGKKMTKIPIPTAEMGPWMGYTAHDGTFHRVCLAKNLTAIIVQKAKKNGFTLSECVPIQYGCTNCETIHTYWMRTDGKIGDLFRIMKARQMGKGKPIADVPGNLKDIMQQ